jgi:hypothetical protein
MPLSELRVTGPSRAHKSRTPERQPDAPAKGMVAIARNPLDTGVRSRFAHYVSRPIQRMLPLLFAGACIATLLFAWRERNENFVVAESGVGYWLGVVGASMMLVMLLYALRKRVRALRWMGSVPAWFRIHMMFGVLGPLLVVLHTNFRLGSLNSTVALIAMLAIVSSGIIGRYLYGKVHKGLYGSVAEAREMLADAAHLRADLESGLSDGSAVLAELREFEERVFKPSNSLIASLWRFLTLGLVIRRTRSRAERKVAAMIQAHGHREGLPRRVVRRRVLEVRRRLRLYFVIVRKALRLAVFERALSLWHVLHLPLFLLLIATAIMHVIAVHVY